MSKSNSSRSQSVRLTARDCGRITKLVEHGQLAVILRLLADIQSLPPKLANFMLNNDSVVTVPIVSDNSDGVRVPYPTGLFAEASTSHPERLSAAIVPGGSAITLTPHVKRAKGIGVKVRLWDGTDLPFPDVDIIAPKKAGRLSGKPDSKRV